MERYHIMNDLNRGMIMGENIGSNKQKMALEYLINHKNMQQEVLSFHKGMKVKETLSPMYPYFYIPSFNNGKKLRLITGYRPKTYLLTANHYELEILRLLALFNNNNETVKRMVQETIKRLQNTCFGNYCTQGECLIAGICVLRLLAVVRPDDESWMNKLLLPLRDKLCSLGQEQALVQKEVPMPYLLLAFSDINNDITKEAIFIKKEWLLSLLRRGWITGKILNGKVSEVDTYNLLIKHIIRNALGTLPEFKNIEEHRIYVNEQDNRCYCDI